MMNQINTLKEYVEADKQSLLIEVSALKKSLKKANNEIKRKDATFEEINETYEKKLKEVEFDLRSKLENQFKLNKNQKSELDSARKTINNNELVLNKIKTD